MRRGLWLAVVSLAVVAGLIGWLGDPQAASAGPSGELTRQLAGNGITVTATLLKEQPESTAIKVALDTYFFNLVRYDVEELAILRDENGRTYPLIAVEQASSLKPRYREAVLRFEKVDSRAKTIELVVKGVAGVKERVFRWSTSQ